MVSVSLDSKTLKKTVDTLLVAVTEAVFDFDPQGVGINVMNPERTVMLEMRIDKDLFQTYGIEETLDGNQKTKFGVDLLKIRTFTSLLSPDKIVNLAFSDSVVKMQSGNLKGSAPLISPSSLTPPKIPPLTYERYTIISANDMLTALKAVESVTEVVTIQMTTEAISISGQGTATEEYMDTNIPMAATKEFTAGATVKSSYATSLITGFFKAVSDMKDVKIMVGNDYPLSVKASSTDGHMKITLIAAPRITNV